jgi:hypothetical protein
MMEAVHPTSAHTPTGTVLPVLGTGTGTAIPLQEMLGDETINTDASAAAMSLDLRIFSP